MKKTIHSCVILLGAILIANETHSQAYLSYDAGWGFAAARSTIGTDYNNNGSSTTYTGVYSSYGKGLQTGLTFGYSLNDHLAFEIGYGYHNMMGEIATRSDYNNSSSGFSYTESQEADATTHRIITGLKLTAGDGDWKPYFKAAFVLGMGNKIDWYNHYSENDNGNTSTSTMHVTYNGGLSMGGAFAVGISKNLSDKLSFFAQGTFIYSSWAPLQGKVVEYTIDGQDMLPNMDTEDKEVEFVDSYTYSGSSNPNEPSKEIKEYMPYSSAGINLGIVLHF